ncbi:hypothetical protein CSKR_111052 [Clonorchis sinensis]|uniref:Uncharacterized protein n=1 Tax=Clonorchis sinensis TaxID=79923 RepID=A0A3R7F5H4_CLOSI|nr:hypothetical protein CSKR_111052 [Clonorchis sinensis]
MFSTHASLPYNHDLFESLIVKKRIKLWSEAQWLQRESTDQMVRGLNPTSASGLFLSRLGQPGSIPALVFPSGGTAVRHRKGATAERFFLLQEKWTAKRGHVVKFNQSIPQGCLNWIV